MDGLREQVDGHIVILGLEGFVSLSLEFVSLHKSYQYRRLHEIKGGDKRVRLTWFRNEEAILRNRKARLLISLPKSDGENLPERSGVKLEAFPKSLM